MNPPPINALVTALGTMNTFHTRLYTFFLDLVRPFGVALCFLYLIRKQLKLKIL